MTEIICTTLLVEKSPQALPLGAACVASAIKHYAGTEKECEVKLISFSREDEEIIKLVNKNANAQPFCPCRNWSYSKGDTYERVCVILTGDTSTIFDDDFSCQEMSVISRNMLYVALTRTKGDLLLITKKQMDSWKKSQQITNSTRNSP